ncbi:MAG: SGNH/GDSL hydrolase family protein, partial [Candidatus Competibacteraceae bacterium]|nr:SGNH/GDSL hydrolase family protein [Candidatus Competibacteraceae bacterium]
MRWFWLNPYSLYAEPHPEFRLHEPGLIAYVNVDNDIYPGTHSIRFAINSIRAVSPGPGAIAAESIALGGSTTECGLIPESQRWPDLLNPPAHNFGVSGNTSLDSYHNLKYLLSTGMPRFKTVLLMHGVNDFDRFLARGLADFENWEPRPIANVLAMVDSADQQVFSLLRIKDSALLSFIRYHSNNLKGRPFYTPLANQAAAQVGQAPLGDSGFTELTQRIRKELMPARETIYRQLADLSHSAGLDLVLLTQ